MSYQTLLSDLLVHNWIALTVAVLLFISWRLNRNFNFWSKRGVQSPPITPFIGNFMSFSIPLPLLIQKHLKKFGAFFGLYLAQRPILIITEPEIIKRILVKDFHLFRNRSGRPRHRLIKLNLIAARDEQWKRIRSILTPMFTALKMKKMETLMQTCIDQMVDSFDVLSVDPANSVDVREHMGNFTMNVIGKCAFATDTKSEETGKENVFVKNAKSFLSFNLLNFIMIVSMPDFLKEKFVQWKIPPFYLKEVGFFDTLTRHIIRERKQANQSKPFNDMLQLMINAEYNEKSISQEGLSEASHYVNAGSEELERERQELKDIIGSKYLSEEEVQAQAVVFLLAGYETTASALSYCLYELAVNPDIQARLYSEIQTAKTQDPNFSYSSLSKLDYLDAVLSETLRKYPPAWILNREASERYRIEEHNLTLDKGQEIMVPVYAIHHSEKYFPQPDRFDPDRFMPDHIDQIIPYTYLPFGGGPRNCIGMRFALTEAKMGLAKILDRFEIVRTAKTTDKLEVITGFFLLRTSPIFVGIKKRS